MCAHPLAPPPEKMPEALVRAILDKNKGSLRVESERPFETIAALGRSGVEVSELRVERPGLERVFLHVTGRSLRD